MASIGHAAIGLLGASWHARPHRPPGRLATAFFVALSFLPDADIAMFAFVPYSHPLGHRGATHSIAFAVALGVLAGIAARAIGRDRAGRTALAAFLVVLSHGLLDTMTSGGGLGVALLWPLDDRRFWAPWRPIPIAPIGLDYFSARGARVFAVESALFLPFFLLAGLGWLPRFRNRRRAG